MSRRRIVLTVIGVLLLVAAGLSLWAVRSAEPRLRRELEVWLSDRLNSDVTVATLTVRLYPTLRVEGTDLILRIKGRPDLPPFVTIKHWYGRGGFSGIRARRLDEVRLDGVEVTVPPGRSADLRSLKGSRSVDDPDESVSGDGGKPVKTPLRIDRLVADAVRLTVLPRDPLRDPTLWDIRDLVMEPFSLDTSTPFTASVDTPLPNDRAFASGHVGPWPRGDFDLLPLSGEYTFEGDLGAVPGLQGKLVASGTALGELKRLATTGTASSASFGMKTKAAGQLPLKVTYEAVLDGTNSDLFLTRVTTVVADSAFEASGRVTRTRGVPGRHIELAVKTPGGADVSDLMRLIVDGAHPPLSGRLTLDVTIDLPQGPADVLDRVVVDGSFALERVRFANPGAQAKVDELSRRGQGRPEDVEIARVASAMRGQVDIRRQQLALKGVRFSVPGAVIEAAGAYGLQSERLDFKGTARLDATMSRTQTGAKRFFMRPLDPLFKKGGAGTLLFVDVQGTRSDPVVDLDVRASLRGRR